MVRVRVYLPVKPGRVRLLLPYAGDEGWAGWLRGMCGEGTRPARDGRVWTVARPHFDAVLRGLARRFGRVGVETRSLVSEKCTRSCQEAKVIGPWDCECVCLGRHHAGGRAGLGWVEVEGDLLVASTVLRRRFEVLHRWADPGRLEGDVFTIEGAL